MDHFKNYTCGRTGLKKKIGAMLAILMLIIITDITWNDTFNETDAFGVGTELRGFDANSTIDINSKKIGTINNVQWRCQEVMINNKNIITSGNTVYYSWIWLNGTSMNTISMKVSYDNGGTWSNKVDIYSLDDRELRQSLYLWNGDIYLFIGRYKKLSQTGYDTSEFQLYVKHVTETSWFNFKSQSTYTIQNSYLGTWDVSSDDDYLYVSFSKQHFVEGGFIRYDGSSWSQKKIIANAGYCFYTNVLTTNYDNDSRVLFFNNRHYESSSPADGYIHQRYSTNNGISFSSASTVMDRKNSYHNMEAIDINGTLIVFSAHRRLLSDDIELAISRDGGTTWSEENVIVSDRGWESYSSEEHSFQVAVKNGGRTVMVFYECSDSRVRMIYSHDWGNNWISEDEAIVLEDQISFDPVVDQSGRFLSSTVKNGSKYRSYIKGYFRFIFGGSLSQESYSRKVFPPYELDMGSSFPGKFRQV